MLQKKIYILNNAVLFFYIYQRILKQKSHFPQKYYMPTIFNIDSNKPLFLSSKSSLLLSTHKHSLSLSLSLSQVSDPNLPSQTASIPISYCARPAQQSKPDSLCLLYQSSVPARTRKRKTALENTWAGDFSSLLSRLGVWR